MTHFLLISGIIAIGALLTWLSGEHFDTLHSVSAVVMLLSGIAIGVRGAK